MKKKEKKIVTFFEIILLIGATFAFAYLLKEAFAEIGLASAQAGAGTQNVWTCEKSKDGKFCQEYVPDECTNKCANACIPTARKNVATCKPGTCYDSKEGTCQIGAPKTECEAFGGQWFDDPNGNIADGKCTKGCCILGDQAMFVTEQQCTRKASQLGLTKDFKADVVDELDCVMLSKTQEEGACVVDIGTEEKLCTFGTKKECLQKGGNFNSGFLCSNPNLQTSCTNQSTIGCVDGKDELYWFDSCGNRENIYDANRVKSWNGGKMLSKDDSCSLGTTTNLLANQGTCGNCNYLLGSRCRNSKGSEKLADAAFPDYVCRDVSCVDEAGNKRRNGESWCVYQGSIGVDENKNRATDVAGSRHFRRVCIDGNVKTEPCADYRNEICVQSDTELDSGQKFSQAACRLNRWQQCYEYNTEVQGKGAAKKATEEERNDKCTANSDCFVKHVEVDKYFKFDMCLPRYSPGFDIVDNGDAAKSICDYGTQKCTVMYVKDIDWECRENCNCEKEKFAQQMNDFCTSLGDCGAKVNYAGDLTINTKTKGAPGLKIGAGGHLSAYLQALKNYMYPVAGKTADIGNLSDFLGPLGIPADLGAAPVPGAPSQMIPTLGAIGGLAGASLPLLAVKGMLPSTLVTQVSGAISKGSIAYGSTGLSATGNMVGAGLAAAAIALSLYSLYTSLSGDNPSMAGAMVAGVGVMSASVSLMVFLKVLPLAAIGGPFALLAIAAAPLVLLLLFKVLGVGKTKKVIVTFTCKPWQPPTGGANCNKCGTVKTGDLTLPCSKYACQSLGGTCEFINEGTYSEMCINNNPNDISPPIISPWQEALNPGFSYETIGGGDGVKVVNSQNSQGCVKSYEKVKFGITTDEASQCNIDTDPAKEFDDMEDDFGDSGLFLYNHSMEFSIPSLDSLGLPGYDPSRMSDFTLYVKCQDKNGNKNGNAFGIQFCVIPGDDLTPPVITGKEPALGYLKYGASEQNVSIFTNEPATCRWDLDGTKIYDAMMNNFSCANDIADQELLGWKCSYLMPITQDVTEFYVNCNDQPWLEDESKRNAMGSSEKITLERSSSPLAIDSISPDNQVLKFGASGFTGGSATIDLTAETSGGLNGNANCEYNLGPSFGNMYIPFFDTGGTTHEQPGLNLWEAGWNIDVRCIDSVGNTASRTANFSVIVDRTFPIITRIYQQDGNLIVMTNENAECAYVNYELAEGQGACAFDFVNGTLFYGNELSHSTGFNFGAYYIKCKDNYGNVPSDCNIVVKKGE